MLSSNPLVCATLRWEVRKLAKELLAFSLTDESVTAEVKLLEGITGSEGYRTLA